MSIDVLTEKAIATIENSFALLPGVAELADMLGVTDCHLIRCFKAGTGLSPGQYLVRTRVRVAKLLLIHRGYSIEATAQMVGFSGANYFCKVFRRATGLSPGAYRTQHSPPLQGTGQEAGGSPLDTGGLSPADKALLEKLDRLTHT